MNSLKMAGVDLRSLVKSDEPDLVFLDGNTAAMLLEDLNYLTSGKPRRYTYWLIATDPIEFIEQDLLTKPFLQKNLITDTCLLATASHYYSLEVMYQWGWISIDFNDQTRYPLPFEDRADALLVNPDAFTRDQKLFHIEIHLEPAWMPGFMERRLHAGDTFFADRLIDMDLIEIAIKYEDAYFYGEPENRSRNIFRPGPHIKGFESAGDTWIFQKDVTDEFGHPWGDAPFFALRKRLPEMKAIYALGEDTVNLPHMPPFSHSAMNSFIGVDSEYLGPFALFGGRDPEDILKPLEGAPGPRYSRADPN